MKGLFTKKIARTKKALFREQKRSGGSMYRIWE